MFLQMSLLPLASNASMMYISYSLDGAKWQSSLVLTKCVKVHLVNEEYFQGQNFRLLEI